jgi:alkanesulfonate monooxygenase SsuD/methylene tetrahydromethanopterin reductase-like flavin-dependent oxidoreductase (luciferase family)
MKIGFFIMPVHPLYRRYADTLTEDRDSFILADKLGFAEAHCGEHLTDIAENIPNSMMFIASLIGSTTQIKLGTAVANLPFSHPVIVATNAALLDNLLKGRFILGIGAGVLPSDAEAMGLLQQDRGAMLAEAIDQIVELWTGKAPYNISGKYWNISTEKTFWPEGGLGDIVKPFQKPHPPIMGTAGDPDSKGLIALGRRGWWPVSSNLLHFNRLSGHWTNYAQGASQAGHEPNREQWRIARSIFVAEDDKIAAAYGGDNEKSPYRFYMNQLRSKLARAKRLNALKAHPEMPDEDVTLEYIIDNIVIRGSVSRVVDQILALREKTGDFGTLLYCGTDWLDGKLARRSMELMAEKVMPAVNAAITPQLTKASATDTATQRAIA